MASPRPDSNLIEFAFTQEELTQARLLNPLQIMYLQTKYALLFKEKATNLVPESHEFDRSFLLKISNIQGKLDMLQEIFDECHAAKIELATPKNPVTDTQGNNTSVIEIATLGDRASVQVHNFQT